MIRRIAATAILALVASCGSSPPTVHKGPHVLADWTRPNGLFDAPAPSDDLGAASTATKWPNPPKSALADAARALVGEDGGFSTTSAVYFPLSDAIDPTKLPGISDSAGDGSVIRVLRVDATIKTPNVPGVVTFQATALPYGAPNLLAFVPLQGTPLLPGARYAAIVTTDLKTTAGVAFEAAFDDDLSPFSDVLPILASHGIDRDHIAGMTVFTVGDPTAGLARGRHAALAQVLPTPVGLTLTDTFTDFCVFHGTIDMPDFQTGTPPFTSSGGTWSNDSTGTPIFQRNETADLYITLPRTAPPTAGYPVVVFVQPGTDVARPLVDRGQEGASGPPALVTGEGPARYLARAGFAGFQVDGPLGGKRNPSPSGDPDALVFNFANPGAVRDTLRESAIELDVLAHVATTIHVDATTCAPAGTSSAGPASVAFDAAHVAIMGHATGAWIAPLAAAEEPLYATMILSGAGGSFANDILFRQKPAPLAASIATQLAEAQVTADDPALALVQWALEPADPQVYTRWFEARAGNSLMIQGIVDEYMPPDLANAISLSLGLDLGGTELDTGTDPRLTGQDALGPLLPLASASTITLPYAGTTNGIHAIVQHPADALQDGDEVMFQTDAPKHQYQCFLASWLATGTPMLDVDAARDAACPK